MEINNVKLDWGTILTPYIRHLEEQMPGENLRERFTPIINDLNANRTKSRVIFSSAKPAAYAFFIFPRFNGDRIYSNIGFTEKENFTEERFRNLVEWLFNEAETAKRFLAIDAPFNVPEEEIGILKEKYNLQKVERISLSLSLESFTSDKTLIPGGYTVQPLSAISLAEYSEIEYNSFRESNEGILFSSSREDRIAFTEAVFRERLFGEVLAKPSFLLYKGSEIAGSIFYTDMAASGARNSALLASIFVIGKFRRMGIARSMLGSSLEILRNLGFGTVILYTNSENDASLKLYREFGFTLREVPHEIFYHNIKSGS